MSGAPDDQVEFSALVRAATRFARRAYALGRPAGVARPMVALDAAPPPETRIATRPETRPETRPQTRPEIRESAQPVARPAAPPAAKPIAPPAPLDGPSPAEAAAAATNLDELRQAVAACRACALCTTRTQTVFSDGAGAAGILFVGEGPGQEEDRTGTPFVGPAGQLLTRIITNGMGLDRARDVYIANVVKCRPPGNRDPEPGEKALCAPFLERQIELVDPRVVIALGRHAATHLLGREAPLARLRGRVEQRAGRAVVATYHPAYLLRSPHKKSECWSDIQLAMAAIGLAPPAK